MSVSFGNTYSFPYASAHICHKTFIYVYDIYRTKSISPQWYKTIYAIKSLNGSTNTRFCSILIEDVFYVFIIVYEG